MHMNTNSMKVRVAQHAPVAFERRTHRFGPGVRSGLGLGLTQKEIHNARRDRADDRIGHEEQLIRSGGHQAADDGANHHRQIKGHAHNAETFGAFLFGHQIGHHRLMRRAGHVGEDAGDQRQHVEHLQ